MVRERELLKLLRNLLEEVTQKYDRLVESKDRKMKELFQVATKDSLTSLYNRYYFQEFFKNALLRVQREKELGKKLALVFLDIDGFKLVNDLYGHERGDWLLKEVASFLSGEMRGSDLVARFGGDEFVMVFEGVDINQSVVARRMEEIRRAFNRKFKDYGISFSYGSVIFPDELPSDKAKNLEEIERFLVGVADYRMYRDKTLRKGLRRERWSAQSSSQERPEKE